MRLGYYDEAIKNACEYRKKEAPVMLAIESSCDETAASVVRGGRDVLSMSVYTQIPIHRKYGGAVLSGVFFGDRCSPVSTSALLVAELTGTAVLKNIRNMLRSAAVPTLAACVVFFLLGRGSTSGAVPDLAALFSRGFRLHWAAALPAAAILVLSACKASRV